MIETHAVPLRLNADGVIRVGETRVTLESVIHIFKNGATAEEIAFQFPVLELADIYAVIGYYLKNSSELDAYLADAEQSARAIKKEVQLQFPSNDLRARLTARQTSPSK